MKKEMKESSYTLKILTWKMFEKLNKSVFQILAKNDFSHNLTLKKALGI